MGLWNMAIAGMFNGFSTLCGSLAVKNWNSSNRDVNFIIIFFAIDNLIFSFVSSYFVTKACRSDACFDRLCAAYECGSVFFVSTTLIVFYHHGALSLIGLILMSIGFFATCWNERRYIQKRDLSVWVINCPPEALT